MLDVPYPQQRILVHAARRPDHRVSSYNADALMSLYAADLVSQDALTPAGLALARRLLEADPTLR